LTRLNKDISHGEFNLCLYGISHMPVSSALPIFEHRLDYLSGLYTHCQTLLAAGLETIAKRLNDESASRLIDKFVRFHIMLYENDYTGATGEYTVGT
jgi:hypothetical protein